MRYSVIAILVSWFGLLLLVVSDVTRNNTLRFHRPAVGGEFRVSSKCTKKAEALLIALSAAPYIFEGYDFGLGEAAETAAQDDCNNWPPTTINASLLEAVHERYEWAQRQYIEAAPPWPLSRFTGYSQSNAVFPSNVFGRLYLLSKNYRSLNSGNGILHYMRCDFSLHLELYQTFWASDLHSETATDVLIERISECGRELYFETLISNSLSEIDAFG